MYPVKNFAIFTGFTCLHENEKNKDLNDFIQHDAERHFLDKIAVTYALESIHIPDIELAFATLQNDSIVILNDDELPEVTKIYPYKAYPAVKIGRFGVNLEYQHKNIGSTFIKMIKNLMLKENRTGCRYITVDARRKTRDKIDATGFYIKNGFKKLACRKKTQNYVPMFFDLKSLDTPLK
jgi:GNAT superfamily N-acetyltransferase